MYLKSALQNHTQKSGCNITRKTMRFFRMKSMWALIVHLDNYHSLLYGLTSSSHSSVNYSFAAPSGQRGQFRASALWFVVSQKTPPFDPFSWRS